MIHVALRMLLGDKAKYIGVLVGLSFTSLLLTQQPAIFLGLMTRTYSFIDDTPTPDLWVMDQEVQMHADNKPLQETALQRVRGVEGVAWAMPMIKQWTPIRLPSGQLSLCVVIGVDDGTFVGAPSHLVRGSIEDLRKNDAIFVDEADLASKFAMTDPETGKADRPLRVGDTLELNDKRAIVVGTYKGQPSFFWDPIIYTTYSRASRYLPPTRRVMNFIMVKLQDGADAADVSKRIGESIGLKALTANEFRWLTAKYIIDKTGIAVNFGLAVLLGFVVGVVITGQTFYNFTMDNLKHFGTFKAMGASNARLVSMVISQSLFAGAVGFGIGVGGAALFGVLIRGTTLAFVMPWPLLLFSGVAVGMVCVLSALFSVRRVLKLEPAAVFKG
jgi:putative ABC transport system permease protein